MQGSLGTRSLTTGGVTEICNVNCSVGLVEASQLELGLVLTQVHSDTQINPD